MNWNESYFSGRTEQVAATAGVMFSDGYVATNGSDNGRLGLEILHTDAEMLLKVANNLELPEAMIRVRARAPQYDKHGNWIVYKPQVQFRVTSRKAASDLTHWGVVPNKTYGFSRPNIPLHLIPAFLHGVACGDASVRFNKSGAVGSLSFAGSEDEIKWIHEMIQTLLPEVEGTRYRAVNKLGVGWSLRFTADESRLVHKLISLEDDSFLRRKFPLDK